MNNYSKDSNSSSKSDASQKMRSGTPQERSQAASELGSKNKK